jgi:hypothetical protein
MAKEEKKNLTTFEAKKNKIKKPLMLGKEFFFVFWVTSHQTIT